VECRETNYGNRFRAYFRLAGLSLQVVFFIPKSGINIKNWNGSSGINGILITGEN
jgi:hypothetical protein